MKLTFPEYTQGEIAAEKQSNQLKNAAQ